MDRIELGRLTVEVPRTRRERRRGLLGRAHLAPDRALLLEGCRSVHTVGMRFPIDAVLLDRGHRVVRVIRLRPWRILLPRPAVRHVLEVAAGAGPPVGVRLAIGGCPTSAEPVRGP